MDKELLFVLLFFWLISAAYVMHWHYKRGDLSLGTVLLALIMGPVLALLIRDNEHDIKKHHYIEENENDRHRRWFQTRNIIDRQRMPEFGRTIPPPPPISRRGPSHVELNMAERIRLENEREKIKDFKFFKK